MDAFDRENQLIGLTKPLYMGLFGRVLLRLEDGNHHEFARDFAALYPQIAREDATDLLSWKDWRPRLVGAYICGFRGWTEFEGCIGRLLVRDELVFASVAYSFALARFAQPSSSTALCAYLWNNFSGRCTDCSSISHAIAALQWIDERNQSDYYERNLGEWREKIESGRALLQGHSMEESRDWIRHMISPEVVGKALVELRELIELSASL